MIAFPLDEILRLLADLSVFKDFLDMIFLFIIDDDQGWGILSSIWEDRQVILLIGFEEGDMECGMDIEGPSEIQLECILVDLFDNVEGSYLSWQEFPAAY